jgi:tetratricopeptide (TPR) repeat protein/tRNA A-37 threonylcarbamoyl transferase component Bud32
MSDAPNTNPAVTSLTAKAGDKVDNYTIMEQVGSGGTAIVFRGHDHVLNRDVAIKQIVVPQGEEGDEIRQRARAESAIHKRVASSDPKLLVQYIDTINEPRGIFLISEYVDGPSLEWILQQETKPMDQRQALGIIAATTKALDALHKGGVVHRDLKPSNILMPREGGLKLADFGLAAIVAEQQTLDLGSVRYMSPEILQGEPATAKSDLYSLGIVAYEMLAGRENFNSAFRTILRDQRNQSMRWVKWHTNVRAKVTPLDQLVDGIPPSLSQLVARMMEKDPARRVGSCEELLEAIRMHFAQQGQGQESTPGPHAAMAPPQIDDESQTAAVPQKSKLPMILGGTLVVWLLAIGAFFVWQNNERKAAEAKATIALINDIEAADDMIGSLQYEDAIKAFDSIPKKHASLFDPNNRRGRDDLVEAGSLKAQSLLAAQRGDFVAAHDKALAYEQLMNKMQAMPDNIETDLGRRDATDLVEDYAAQSAFQQQTADIDELFNQGKLDEAIIAIRQLKSVLGTSVSDDQLSQIEAFERRHTLMIGDQRVAKLVQEAMKLEADGELKEAIDVLETEIENAGDSVSKSVTDLAAQYNKRLQIVELKEELAEAEKGDDLEEILAAIRRVQDVQPTQAGKVRIEKIEIQLLLIDAQEALDDGRPGGAESILRDVLERDPGNIEAEQMLASLKDARMKIEFERKGDALIAQGKYQEAIAMYQNALKHGPDSDGSINAKIKNASGQVHLTAAEEALEAGDIVAAQDRLDKAGNDLGKTDAVLDLQDEIDELREYTLMINEGDAFFEKNEFGKAKSKYIAAKQIFDSEAINEKISDCDFGSWLQQCDGHILRREWDQAIGALNQAEQIKKNDQTKARREQIENRVQ